MTSKVSNYKQNSKRTFCNDYYVRLEGDYGWIYHGWNTDADYLPDDQTLEDTLFLNRKPTQVKGESGIFLCSFLIYEPFGDCFSFRPLLGYSVHSQRFKLEDVSSLSISLNPLLWVQDFRISIQAIRLIGQVHGSDSILLMKASMLDFFRLRKSFNALYYDAKGNWNLREDILGDFHINGWGWGYFTKFNAQYDLGCGWDLGAQLKYNYCRMNDGRDQFHNLEWRSDLLVYKYDAYTKIKHATGILFLVCWL